MLFKHHHNMFLFYMSDPGPKCKEMLQNYNAANGLKVDGSKVLPIYTHMSNLKGLHKMFFSYHV